MAPPAGLPIHETRGHFVVSIGAGTTEVAVISMGAVVAGTSLRHGGADLDAAIVSYLADHFDLAVGEVSAEQIKVGLGSVVPTEGITPMPVRGRDTRTGLPREIELSGVHVRKALQQPIDELLAALRRVLDETPPEVSGDLVRTGLSVTGGGSLLRGLPERLEHDLGVPVRRPSDPRLSVVDGAGRCADNIASVRRLLLIEPTF